MPVYPLSMFTYGVTQTSLTMSQANMAIEAATPDSPARFQISAVTRFPRMVLFRSPMPMATVLIPAGSSVVVVLILSSFLVPPCILAGYSVRCIKCRSTGAEQRGRFNRTRPIRALTRIVTTDICQVVENPCAVQRYSESFRLTTGDISVHS